MADAVIDVAFSEVADLENAIGERLGQLKSLAQVRDDLVVEEPLQLVGHAGKGDDDAARVVDDEGWGSAIRVMDGKCTFGDVGLSLIVGGHDEPAPAEALLDVLQQCGIAHQLSPGGVGDGLTGQVVLGRAEAAARDDDVRAAEGAIDYRLHAVGVVTDDGLVVEVDADIGEASGHPGRVGVDDLAEQELGADGNYLSVRHSL